MPGQVKKFSPNGNRTRVSAVRGPGHGWDGLLNRMVDAGDMAGRGRKRQEKNKSPEKSPENFPAAQGQVQDEPQAQEG
jgi:hypothetical protein